MATALSTTDKNPFLPVEANNIWTVAATGMNKNSAKSTGGYVSYTAG
jgi:hypothetical protein